MVGLKLNWNWIIGQHKTIKEPCGIHVILSIDVVTEARERENEIKSIKVTFLGHN